MDEAAMGWEQACLTDIFRARVQEENAASSASPTVYLAELADELAGEDGGVPVLRWAVADRLLIARLSDEQASETSWDFLVGAWVRCCQAEQRVRAAPTSYPSEALGALQHVRGLLVSYAGLVVEMPDMFPRSEKHGETLSAAALVPTLLQLAVTTDDNADASVVSAHDWAAPPPSLAHEFVTDLVSRFAPEDALDGLLGEAMHALTQRILASPSGTKASQNDHSAPSADQDVYRVLAQMLQAPMPPATGGGVSMPSEGMTLSELDWQPIARAIAAALDIKALAAAVPSFSSFSPTKSTAATLERESLFGPLLRLSCFPDAFPSMTRELFADAKSRSPVELESTIQTLRMSLGVVQKANYDLFHRLVRAGAEPRERVLSFWGRLCELNARRGALQVSSHEVASDAFMVNVYDMLLRFAEPFAEPTCAKMDRVDARYLQYQRRYSSSTLTRLLASEAEAQAWEAAAVAPAAAPHFITEVFFLTARLSSLALGKVLRKMDQREKEMDRLRQRIDELEEGRAQWANTPQGAHLDAMITRARAQTSKLHSEMVAVQTQLLEPGFLDRVLSFVSFTMTWLVRMVDPRGAHPHVCVALPLPAEVPETVRMLPEYLFEDVCEVVLFYARRKPDVMSIPVLESITTFCTVFLSCGWYVRNPFLKAKLAEMLSYLVMPYGPLRAGVLSDTLNTHPLALSHLVPALMTFWIEAESTGSNTQFYDKFNIRFHLSQVFQAIWDTPEHKRQLHDEAREHQSGFVVFINRLMNDVTFLLEDALDKLTELHAKQVEMQAPEWASRAVEERHEGEGLVWSLQGQIRSDLALGHAFLRLLILFTKETSASFMMPEIVERLAAMLDYNLDVLVGPRCQELKVQDPKKVGFDPKNLLSEILSVFLNLASHHEFVVAIARDGRSYRREIFSKAASIAQRFMLKSPVDIDTLADLVERVEQAKQADADEEEDLGEVPDEYLDPLLATIMRDPVRLPSSRAVVDRSTIKAHLLSDGTDPFNRMPLKLEDVQPDDALRAEIEAWVRARRSASAPSAPP
ncbi:RING-type E3 ubiquitin transferase [Malassezia nana]|uniref:RING-type E3 ubiquitin transferase n=1 Tax=Malassezia nana TaxID=180528 RepID=A0AAF0ENC8_9BASI|nr:RING-type E3 ubiquitin transferase [Malassezia nana]